MNHLNITIFGQVQGVFFRSSAKEQADKLGIKGFAQNQPDGSVYIEAEGKPEELDQFVKWCRQGPALARIKKVNIAEGKIENFSKFEVY